jgi:hypothetical protein
MRTRWTREKILRYILEREADGRALNAGGEGIDPLLYSAARRIFGSWRNAIIAAGIPPERVMTWERWSPARILAKIRQISRRRRPLTTDQVEHRYHNLVTAARRHFGSWSKAVLAAGVDPTKLQRVVPWTRERVVEAILTRALRGEPLVARLIEPRSLVESGQRFFGSWQAALTAAGVDPRAADLPPRRSKRSRSRQVVSRRDASAEAARAPWNEERIIEAIHSRLRAGMRINAWAVSRDDSSLYGAAKRCLGGWDDAIRAAGLDPAEYKGRRSKTPPDSGKSGAGPFHVESQTNNPVRPEGSV